MTSTSRWTAFIAAGAAAAALAVSSDVVRAQSSSNRPIAAKDFNYGSVRGFGDRNNSWPQSMVWWHDALYVGTTRQSLCTSLAAVYQFAASLFGWDFADTYLAYPPNDPDLACAPDPADIDLAAEIWRWTPAAGWQRVFQSPVEIPNPGVDGFIPPPPGKFLPYDTAFRGMAPFVEADGTEALYAFGVNSSILWQREKMPPPRILRTTDGITWTPVPQTPGTFLGDLPFNPDHSSFRSPVAFDGRLWVLSGPVFGQGTLIGSANPSQGDDAWFLASPPDLFFYEIASFNGWLYLGTFAPGGAGYAVVKTKAQGTPPYDFIPVVPPGAFLTDRPAKSVVSMQVVNGRLYVGTATQTEIIRINPDDTWDLVVGEPRDVPLAGGGFETKHPISGLKAGFGHTLNDHAWEMVDAFRNLYVGTYNASIASKNDPMLYELLKHNMGAHLYRTLDTGWFWQALTTDGFTDVALKNNDPGGGKFDYGLRTMVQTQHGAFFGSANDYYGTMIFRAESGSKVIDPPARLEVEALASSGKAHLSWDGPKGTYEVYRAEVKIITVRDDANFEAWNGQFGTKIPDTFVGPYSLVCRTSNLYCDDETVEDGHIYMYYAILQQNGKTSDQSNLVTFPNVTPPVTYVDLLKLVDTLEARGRYNDPLLKLSRERQMIQASLVAAGACKIKDAIKALQTNKAVYDTPAPEATDIEILMSKMIRRLDQFTITNRNLVSGEICQ